MKIEKQYCPVCKGKHKAWDIGCKNRKNKLRQVQTTHKQLPTYHQIHRSLSLAQAKQSSAKTESHQEIEIEPIYTQEILPISSKAIKQRQKLNTVARRNCGANALLHNWKHHLGAKL